jgi:anti-sigma factor RsiW
MNCEQLLQALNSYVDGDVDPEFCQEFASHLAGCNPCQVVVDNIRQTITLYRDGEPYPVPPEFQSRLRQILKAKWREKFGVT